VQHYALCLVLVDTSGSVCKFESIILVFSFTNLRRNYFVYSEFISFCIYSVRKQLMKIPSFIVRLDSQEHIDFALRSPFAGGRAGRVKRENLKGTDGGDGSEEDDE